VADLLLRGGLVVDGGSGEPRRADVAVTAGRIQSVATDPARAADVIDCTDRLVLPGFVDAHSHADAAIFQPDTQRALLRQGVTTIIAGQDGVSYAPGDGGYATEYFAALLGPHPLYRGGGVGALLAGYDQAVRCNVGYLVPHGTVRYEVMGRADRAPTDAERRAMLRLVARAMAEGALGMSSGLDYVPGLFADAAELTLLCTEVARADGIYVAHMRGGYESHSRVGVDEVRAIQDGSGVRAHISHLHGPAALLLELLAGEPELTFDAYPYRAGFTLLSMPVLPADLLALGSRQAAERLADPVVRGRLLRDWLPRVAAQPHLGAGWTQRVTLGYVGAPGYRWAAGYTIAAAAARAGRDPDTFMLDLLAASDLAVSAVMPLPPGRSADELAAVLTHDAHLVGTDGIYLGTHPHPRAWGTFGRYLARYVRERAELSWAQAAAHLSSRAAVRFRLGRRGFIRPGYLADLAVIDPATVADTATYGSPRGLGTGIADVLVAGIPVLRDGELTEALPGTGLRRAPAAER
jgi:N-acyl-D-amino-acid deacylase